MFIADRQTARAVIDEDTGFLTAPVKLARIGVQHYMGYELGLTDRAADRIGVLRSPDDVFSSDSIASFTNLVITNDHPAELVTVDNVKLLQVGTVSGVSHDADGLTGVITITDAAQIARSKGGKVEVSVGYLNDLIERVGTYEGVEYEYAQTNIKANHLAIVDAGRCGPACKITIDHKKERTVKIAIDGIEYDVEDTQLAQAIRKQQKSHDAEKVAMKKEADMSEEEMKKMEEAKKLAETEKEKATAAKDAAIASSLDEKAVDKLVGDRAELLVTAKAILKDKMPECTNCPTEIKAAVIDSVLDMGDLSAKSAEYINAAYDVAIAKVKKATGSLDSLSKDFQKDDDGKTTRTTARDKYMKDQLGMEV